MRIIKRLFIVFVGIILMMNMLSCSKVEKLQEPEIKPLVRIGDISISKDEFIRRAEYTIRPVYAKGNLNIHKKIILNSLIAEKLMAMEVDEDSLIQINKNLKNYITGRKNQAIRQMHYYNIGTKKAKVDPSQINEIFKKAGRKYQLIFLNMPNVKMANEFLTFIQNENMSFANGVKEITGDDNLPIKEINYNNAEISEIHEILYNSEIDKSRIYGPIKTMAGSVILFQVMTWIDTKVITDEQVKLRYNDVTEKVTRFEADKIYSKYVGDIMAGKRMDFNRDTFVRLAKLYGKLYSITNKINKELMNKEMWGKDANLKEIDTLQQGFDDLKNSVLLSLDGEDWTVEMFQQELNTHPLVFRKNDITGSEFPAQFRLAIADLIRDKFITEDAYQKGYDKLSSVQNYTDMWKDNVVSQYYRDKFLYEQKFDGNFSTDYLKAIHQKLNPLVDSLQQKYSDQIYIDTEMFNQITLTKIDLYAMQNNVPYPIVVPNFPVLTDDNKLDYGKKMND